jgi:hypothetical protein
MQNRFRILLRGETLLNAALFLSCMGPRLSVSVRGWFFRG